MILTFFFFMKCRAKKQMLPASTSVALRHCSPEFRTGTPKLKPEQLSKVFLFFF
jgi:hypothetical protein